MKILKIRAKNYRSFGFDGIEYTAKPNLNIIVGENNVGKSNLIKTYQEILNQIGGAAFESENYHNNNKDEPVHLSIELTLEDQDVLLLMEKLDMITSWVEDFDKIFGRNLTITYESSPRLEKNIRIKFDNLWIKGRKGGFFDFGDTGYQPQGWSNYVSDAKNKNINLFTALKNNLDFSLPSGGAPRLIEFPKDFGEIISEVLQERIIVFPEFRQRPVREGENILLSPEGRGIASVLFNLKTGDLFQRKRFESIQQYFSQIFPNLKLDVRKGNQIVIVKSDEFEIPQEWIGAGIVEIIIFLTHLKGYYSYVFMIDEPENHLHPHAKRSVANLVKEASEQNQVFCITHSTHFTNTENVDNITRVRDNNGESELIHIEDDFFNSDEVKKILRITSPEQKEFLFARAVLLVEGETETGAFPIFARRNGFDLDANNISVISVESHFFATFVKLLRGFKLPHLILCDVDTISTIETSIIVKGAKIKTCSLLKQLHLLRDISDDTVMRIVKTFQNSIITKNRNGKTIEIYDEETVKKIREDFVRKPFFVLEGEFEDIFNENEFKELKEEANRKFKRSKVIKGRYIAENCKTIPKVVEEILGLLKKIASN